MLIIRRPPGDLFTFRLFYKLTKQLKSKSSLVYIWSTALDPSIVFTYFRNNTFHEEDELFFRKLLFKHITEDTIVIGVKDHLTSGDFNPWTTKTPLLVEQLIQLCQFYNDKRIVLFTSVENLEAYIDLPNATIIPWGGDLVNHQPLYKHLQPITDKNFDSPYSFISLNRNPRAHRGILLSLIHGLNMQENGMMSCMFKDKINNILDWTDWQFRDDQLHIKTDIVNGFDLFKQSDNLLKDDWEIYKNNDNDNVSNFKNKLSNYYCNTFVEIISETSYTEKAYLLTEKTQNTIYACNFPILICSKGAVSFLREMGMDVFDDVIDHSYDSIENPIDRMYTALTANRRILTDPEYAKDKWKECKSRFLQNVAFAKSGMYDYYTTRATQKFNQLAL